MDGEIVAVDGTGKPAFYDLIKRNCQAVYYAFDILWLNGRDLRGLSLLEIAFLDQFEQLQRATIDMTHETDAR